MTGRQHEHVGWPVYREGLPGIDRVGQRFRAGADVSVFRTGNVHGGAGIFIGDDVMLFDRVRLLLGDADTRLTIGDRVGVNVEAYLSGEGGLEIGDDVLIGARAMLLSAGHGIDGGALEISRNPIVGAPIRVGRGAWIGAGSIVLPGVSIGDGAVIGAGSVVTLDVAELCIAVGNPARTIRRRSLHGESSGAPSAHEHWLKRLLRGMGIR
ncbi:MAG: acyltransferase [Rhodocyclaceae bacterium]|nr:acyltransferase [Rhodocyclaceae bacterium]